MEKIEYKENELYILQQPTSEQINIGKLWFDEGLICINTLEFIINKVMDNLKYHFNYNNLLKDPEFFNKVGSEYMIANNPQKLKLVMEYLINKNDLLWVELLFETLGVKIFKLNEYLDGYLSGRFLGFLEEDKIKEKDENV